MSGFQITTLDGQEIRFRFYLDTAPVTSKAFADMLPFTLTFYHARTSGQEFWVADAFEFDIIQENASVLTEPGEITLGPKKPGRAKAVSGAIGVYYGEGKGLDASNIFGKVFDEDLPKLRALGEKIWKEGQQALNFSKLD